MWRSMLPVNEAFRHGISVLVLLVAAAAAAGVSGCVADWGGAEQSSEVDSGIATLTQPLISECTMNACVVAAEAKRQAGYAQCDRTLGQNPRVRYITACRALTDALYRLDIRACERSGCTLGLNCCSDQCVSLSSDEQNCGGCGIRCADTFECFAGACRCGRIPNDGRFLELCGNRCVDIRRDPQNCGGCGQTCPAGAICRPAGFFQNDARCECPAGTTACGADCVDLLQDPQNCGACGNACTSAEACLTGQCVSQEADLSLTPLAIPPDPVAPADSVQFQFYVNNQGPGAATTVTTSIDFSAGLTQPNLIVYSAAGGSVPCGVVALSGGGNLATCTVPRLEPGQTATIEGSATTTAPGQEAAFASVGATQSDPDQLDNAAEANWLVECPQGTSWSPGTQRCACQPKAPSEACTGGQNCGTAPDGCGGTVSCGACTPPQTCDGGGIQNQCGCTPLSAGQACTGGQNCGTAPDGCGGSVSCGTCPDLETCEGNRCVPICQGVSANGAPPGCFPTRDDALAAACAFNNPDLSTPGYAYYRDSCVFNSSDPADTSFTVYAHWTDLSSGNTGYFNYQGDPSQFQPCEFPCP